MLRWTITFFTGALIAGLFEFGCIAEGAISIARVLYFIFIGLTALSVIFEKKLHHHILTIPVKVLPLNLLKQLK
jgi:uncharacterized membrane protein YtjA (UPF0391 family)